MLRRWFAPALDRVALFVMQSEEDARRIEALGVPWSKIRMKGNIKYDLPAAPPFRDAERLIAAAAGRPVFVAASTDEGEEATIVAAAKALAPRALTAIAPRRPEAGLSVLRRSVGELAPADVYLLDTIGELAALYAHAKIAFIGGSLVARGGHNPIEAWAAGVPVIVGPHTENFREVIAKGEELAIATRISRGDELADRVERELADRPALEARAAAAREFVSANRGAAESTAREVLPLLTGPPMAGGAAR